MVCKKFDYGGEWLVLYRVLIFFVLVLIVIKSMCLGFKIMLFV